MQSIQFTLEQVADYLAIPVSAVKRLSSYFKIPVDHYNASGIKPGLMLFQASDVKILKKIQHFLIAGKTLEEITFLLNPEKSNSVLKESLANVEYQESESMKEQLAKITFKQYRQNKIPKQSPFMSLAGTLQNERNNRINLPISSKEPAFTLTTKEDNTMSFPVMSPHNSWQISFTGKKLC